MLAYLSCHQQRAMVCIKAQPNLEKTTMGVIYLVSDELPYY